MKLSPILPILMAMALPAISGAASTDGYTTIGQPGNAPDKNGYGAVDHLYKISSAKVSNRQYASFLNTIDPTGQNALGVFNAKMQSVGGINLRPDAAEGQHYAPRKGAERSPAQHVGWLGAARYVNWLSNGAKRDSSTETGTYNLVDSKGAVVDKAPDARFWIPTENEWYKAAYYRSGKNGGYRKASAWNGEITAGKVNEIVAASPGLSPVAEKTDGTGSLRFDPAVVGESLEAVGEGDDGFRVASGNDCKAPEAEGTCTEPVAEACPTDCKTVQPLEGVAEGPAAAPGYVPVFYPSPPFLNNGLNGVLNEFPPAS